MLLLPGWACRSIEFQSLVDALPQKPVIEPIWKVDGNGLDRYSDWIIQNSGEGIVIGCSMGALAALQAAIRAPKKFHRLILISGFSSFLQNGGFSERHIRALKLKLRTNREKAVREFFSLAHAPLMIPESAALHCSDEEVELLLIALDYLCHTDVTEDVQALKFPTLILHGEADKVAPFSHALKLQKLIPNSTLLSFQDAGHMLHSELPTKLAEAIREFTC